MKGNDLVAILVAIPVLVLFLGVGVLAAQIADTWTPQMTNQLITGLVMSCGAGAVLMGIVLALVVGIPMALRYMEAKNRIDAPRARRPVIEGSFREVTPPPALPNHNWGGIGHVDLLEDSDEELRLT